MHGKEIVIDNLNRSIRAVSASDKNNQALVYNINFFDKSEKLINSYNPTDTAAVN